MFGIESIAKTSITQSVPGLRRGWNDGKKAATAMAVLLFLSMAGCGGGGGDAAPAADGNPVVADVTSPTVEYRYPESASGAINSSEIQSNGIYVIFDEPVKDTTISNANFTVVDGTRGAAPVAGTVSYTASTRTVRFMPTTALTALFNYTATVTTGIEDLAGNHLATPYTWQFTIAGPTAPPQPPMP